MPRLRGKSSGGPDLVCSLAPIADQNSRIVVLGTLPSRLSLLKNEYYGNPQNAFWRIVDSLFECSLRQAPYDKRISNLLGHGVALWDVLRQGRRERSSDSTIVEPVANDLGSLLEDHPSIDYLAFNGRNALRFYRELIEETGGIRSDPDLFLMPSTSAANAMSFNEKVRRWMEVKELL